VSFHFVRQTVVDTSSCATLVHVTGPESARVTNLTISIDEKVIRKARVRAINEGTSISARIRKFLAVYVEGENRQQSAARNFIASARRSKANRDGVAWARADAYDRASPSARAAERPPP
jgi:plasmid stability protein